MLDRRRMMLVTGGAAMVAGLPERAAATAPADRRQPPFSAAEAHRIYARLVGDLSGRTVYFYSSGAVWGFMPQADELTTDAFARHIYGSSGIAARKMRLERDGSITVRQKSWSFYRNAETDEISDRIPNIYTGVIDTASPLTRKSSERTLGALPAGAAVGAGNAPYNMQIRRTGGRAFVSTSNITRFRPPDISWYKLEGALENFACAAADLDNQAMPHVPCTNSLNVVAEWQTWTRMHGRPGHILFKLDGVPILDADALPADTIAALDKFFPGELAEVRRWTM